MTGLPETAITKGPARHSRARGHTPFGRVLYVVLWVLSRTFGVAMFGVRTRFAEPLPARGGLLVLSSHLSHLDPLLLGLPRLPAALWQWAKLDPWPSFPAPPRTPPTRTPPPRASPPRAANPLLKNRI